jgi:hypothetical protein
MAGIHSSESLQFLQFSPNVPLGLANKSGVNHPLVFSSFWVKGDIQMEGVTQALIELAGLSSGPSRTSDVLFMFVAFFPYFLHASQ